jgi:hypothetical protein
LEANKLLVFVATDIFESSSHGYKGGYFWDYHNKEACFSEVLIDFVHGCTFASTRSSSDGYPIDGVLFVFKKLVDEGALVHLCIHAINMYLLLDGVVRIDCRYYLF